MNRSRMWLASSRGRARPSTDVSRGSPFSAADVGSLSVGRFRPYRLRRSDSVQESSASIRPPPFSCQEPGNRGNSRRRPTPGAAERLCHTGRDSGLTSAISFGLFWREVAAAKARPTSGARLLLLARLHHPRGVRRAARMLLTGQCPQRDSNPRYGLERAATWAASRWGPRGQHTRAAGREIARLERSGNARRGGELRLVCPIRVRHP